MKKNAYDEFYKYVQKHNGDVDKAINNTGCLELNCGFCIFSSENNGASCGTKEKEYYLEKINKYFEDAQKEKLNEVALTKIIENEVEEINNCMEEKKMSLKERVLAKINYEEIAREVYDLLERDIEDEVVADIDAYDIAKDLLSGYRSDFIEVAKEVILEDVLQDIEVGDVEDEFKSIVEENM